MTDKQQKITKEQQIAEIILAKIDIAAESNKVEPGELIFQLMYGLTERVDIEFLFDILNEIKNPVDIDYIILEAALATKH